MLLVNTEKKTMEQMKPLKIMKTSRILLRFIYILSKFPLMSTLFLFLLRPLYEPTRETWLNRKFRYGLLTFGGGLLPPDLFKAYGYGAKAVLDNFMEVKNAIKNDDPIVWVEWILNAELLEAFGVTSFCSAALNVFGNIDSMATPSMMIEEAEKQGVPSEYCSAMKLDVGAYFMDQIPRPAVTIAGSHPCDTNVSVSQTLEYLIGVPSYVLDVPYWKDEGSYEYFAEQIWKQIEFLEKQLGIPMDWDRFRTLLERVNEFNYYLQDICEMHRAIPSPGSMIDLGFAWVVREINIRSPHALTMAKLMHKSVKKNFLKHKGVVKDEKVRVLLWFPPIAFFTYIFKWMEHEFGAVIVSDFIGQVSTVPIDTSSKESMVLDFARTQMNLAMGRQCHGPIEFITEEMVRFIDDYQVDCMIFTGHQGCKHGWAALRIIQDICRQKGLPVLYLSIDIMDQRYLDEQGVKDEITDFMRSHGWA